VLAIGYYDDFARFFLAIKKELKLKDEHIEFKYMSVFLSGTLYFLFRFQQVIFLPFQARIKSLIWAKKYKTLAKKNNYKGVNLSKLIIFNKYLSPNKEIEFRVLSVIYIDIIEKYLKREKPDLVILSGDTRIMVGVFVELTKIKNIPVYYFEQGPFGTTIFDEKGVNANASLRGVKYFGTEYSISEKKAKVDDFLTKKRRQTYYRIPFYRLIDYLIQFILHPIGLLPLDLYLPVTVNKISTGDLLQEVDLGPKEKLFLLVLQVPYDANMTNHSPFFSNHSDILKNVYEALPKNAKLVVREHPLFKGRYEKEVYDFMMENEISLDLKPLYQSIDTCDVVIVNNSTVGVEAISRMKQLIVLGNAYYDDSDVCLKLKHKTELESLLEKSLVIKVNEDKNIDFLYFFLFEFLLDGHFRDEDLIIANGLVERLFNDKYSFGDM